MEKYVKAVLYIYPRLGELEEDYAEHIRNRAVMSYDFRYTAERAAEYIAGEIIAAGQVRELRELVGSALTGLGAREELLLELRYFRRRERAERLWRQCPLAISRRGYFRCQNRLLKKMEILLRRKGLTKEEFFRTYASLDWMEPVYRFVEEGRDGLWAKERALVGLLADGARGMKDWRNYSSGS